MFIEASNCVLELDLWEAKRRALKGRPPGELFAISAAGVGLAVAVAFGLPAHQRPEHQRPHCRAALQLVGCRPVLDGGKQFARKTILTEVETGLAMVNTSNVRCG